MHTMPPVPNTPFLPPVERAVIERLEMDTWEGIYRLAPEPLAAAERLDVGFAGGALLLAAPTTDVLFFNRVIGLGTQGPVSEPTVDEIVDAYARRGVARFFVQLCPDPDPPALVEWLTTRGFVHHNSWVKLVRGVEEPPEVTTDLEIRLVDGSFAEWIASATAPAFDWPPFARTLVARCVGQPGWRHYVAFDGAMPVATAALYIQDEYGYLGPAVTLPDHRGRGAQSAFIARRIRDAAALNCTRLVVETAEDRPDRPVVSFRNLRRFGFEVAYVRPNYLLDLRKR